jgi:hypothetical protein
VGGAVAVAAALLLFRRVTSDEWKAAAMSTVGLSSHDGDEPVALVTPP